VSSTVSYTDLEEQLLVGSNEWSALDLICSHLFEVPSYVVSMHCHCTYTLLWIALVHFEGFDCLGHYGMVCGR